MERSWVWCPPESHELFPVQTVVLLRVPSIFSKPSCASSFVYYQHSLCLNNNTNVCLELTKTNPCWGDNVRKSYLQNIFCWTVLSVSWLLSDNSFHSSDFPLFRSLADEHFVLIAGVPAATGQSLLWQTFHTSFQTLVHGFIFQDMYLLKFNSKMNILFKTFFKTMWTFFESCSSIHGQLT